MSNHLREAAVLAALLCLSSLYASDDMESSVKSMTEAYAIAEDNAADPVSAEQAFYQGAIPGMLRRLDPHSVFFDPGQFEQLKKMEIVHAEGVRQRGVGAARARDRAADAAGDAVGQVRHCARGRDHRRSTATCSTGSDMEQINSC